MAPWNPETEPMMAAALAGDYRRVLSAPREDAHLRDGVGRRGQDLLDARGHHVHRGQARREAPVALVRDEHDRARLGDERVRARDADARAEEARAQLLPRGEHHGRDVVRVERPAEDRAGAAVQFNNASGRRKRTLPATRLPMMLWRIAPPAPSRMWQPWQLESRTMRRAASTQSSCEATSAMRPI